VEGSSSNIRRSVHSHAVTLARDFQVQYIRNTR
jgi:hypothetical protein